MTGTPPGIWSDEEIAASLDLQKHVPGVEAMFQRFQAASAEVGPNLDKWAYGPSSDEYVVELPPSGEHEHAPVIVFIHGGYWRAFTADDFLCVAPPLCAEGYRVLSINYGLCPAVSFEALVTQVNTAVATIAKRFPGRPLWIGGHSAGAHLALLATGNPAWGRQGNTTNPVARLYLVSGLYDLQPVSRSFLQPVLKLSEEDVRNFSPMFAEVDRGISVDILYGALETPIFRAQSRDLQAALAGAGVSATLHEIAGVNHFDILFSLFSSGPGGLLDRMAR